MTQEERNIVYLGSTEKDANRLPEEVKELFTFALILARAGKQHDDAKTLKGFGGCGVMEVVADDRSGTYREVYTVRFEEAVYVLHIFQKKSKKGIATPKQDMELIKNRLKWAEALHKAQNEKNKKRK